MAEQEWWDGKGVVTNRGAQIVDTYQVMLQQADEIASLKENVRMLNQLCEFNEESQRRLIEQLAECKKDAERYRWLRDHSTKQFLSEEMVHSYNWDASVDAAMAQKEESNGNLP